MFISYSPASEPTVLEIRDRLGESGFKVWTVDENTCMYLKLLLLLLLLLLLCSILLVYFVLKFLRVKERSRHYSHVISVQSSLVRMK